MSDATDRMSVMLNRLCKFRMILAGQHVGTKTASDIETRAFRDLYDKLLIMRAEHSALTALLMEKGLITADEFAHQVSDEAAWLISQYQQKYPGVTATDQGLTINRDKVSSWLKDFRP